MREEKILPYSNVFWFHLKNFPEFFLLRLFYTYFEFLRCSKYVLYLALDMLLLQPCHFRPWTEHRTFSLSHNNLNVPMDNSQLTFQRIKIMIDNMDTRTIYQLFVRSVRFLSGPARAMVIHFRSVPWVGTLIVLLITDIFIGLLTGWIFLSHGWNFISFFPPWSPSPSSLEYSIFWSSSLK